jgi:DNA polymerase III delta subunit
MIAFVHGPDALLVRQQVRALCAELDPSGSNTTRLDGRMIAPNQIATMVGTPAFLGMGRVLIVDDLFAVKRGSKSSDSDDEKSPAPSKDALGILATVAPGNALIISEPSLSSVPAAVKKIAPDIQVRSGLPPRGRELVSWVTLEATAAGSSIDDAAVTSLLNVLYPGTWQQAPSNPRYDVPPDLDRLQQEVRKLAAFAHPRTISRDDVSAMVQSSNQDQLFPFLGALFGGRVDEAVRMLQQVLDNGDDHFRVLAQVMQQIELATPLEAASGASPETVGRDLAVPNPKRMHAIERSSRSHPATPMLNSALQADRDQKRGRLRNAEDALLAIMADAGTQKRNQR